MKKVVIFFVVFNNLVAFASSGTLHNQWFNNSVRINLSKGYFINLSEQHKYTEHYFDNLYSRNWVLGLGKKAGKGLVSLNYKQELKDGVVEERFFVDYTLFYRVFQKISFSLRQRLERRHFKNFAKKGSYRLRFMFKFSFKIKVFQHVLNPYIAVEPQFSSVGNRFCRNRAYAGLKLKLNRNTKFNFGYMREDNAGKTARGVFYSGFNFYF